VCGSPKRRTDASVRNFDRLSRARQHSWRIRTGELPASGLQWHFQKRRKRAPAAPIPKGHQARLYHRRANTIPHDSSQPRTFPDNVPHSKRTRLRIRRERAIGWAYHQGGPRTSVANDRLPWSSVGFLVATPNATSNQFGDVEASGWPAQVRTSPVMPIVHPLIGSELRSLQLVTLVHKRRPQDDHAATPRGAPDFLQ
jgi:hypothetical protein